jgi:hypothetical protein
MAIECSASAAGGKGNGAGIGNGACGTVSRNRRRTVTVSLPTGAKRQPAARDVRAPLTSLPPHPMPSNVYASKSTDELRRLVRARNVIALVIAGIFGVIILAWVVLGYWRDNLPVFLSTLVLALSTQVMMRATSGGLVKELARREAAGE